MFTFIWHHADGTTHLWEACAGLGEQLEAEGI